ncbi:hypothetical protein, partial [Desulforhabdus sp. TSK]|uniref:hypothetical protein n=1 Tax=Desulforhabdus sp. TSK TaxID=2925014 RepID=UPI001FC8AA73
MTSFEELDNEVHREKNHSLDFGKKSALAGLSLGLACDAIGSGSMEKRCSARVCQCGMGEGCKCKRGTVNGERRSAMSEYVPVLIMLVLAAATAVGML